MSSQRLSLSRVLLGATAALALACSAAKDSDDNKGSTSSVGGSSTNTGGGFALGGNNAGGGDCPAHCSSDLHQLVDCNGNVIETCPDHLGCSPNGGCVDPCESAKENASTIGCDFYSTTPAPMSENTGSCFAALIANTWTTPVTITASYGTQTFDINQIARVPTGNGPGLTYQPLAGGQLPAGQIAIVFLSQFNSGQIYWTPCPSGTTTAMGDTHVGTNTGYGTAFRLTTDRPIVAYDIYPYGGASSFVTSATLLVPTPTWGDNFVAVDAFEMDPNLEFANGMPFVQIVAAEDNTTLTLNSLVAIQGGGAVPPSPANTPTTYTL